MNPIKQVIDASDSLTHKRSRNDIFVYATGEMGELAEEVGIANGFVLKPKGKEGILGEACDVMICLLDLIRKEYPNATPDELTELITITMASKTNKWIQKYK